MLGASRHGPRITARGGGHGQKQASCSGHYRTICARRSYPEVAGFRAADGVLDLRLVWHARSLPGAAQAKRAVGPGLSAMSAAVLGKPLDKSMQASCGAAQCWGPHRERSVVIASKGTRLTRWCAAASDTIAEGPGMVSGMVRDDIQEA